MKLPSFLSRLMGRSKPPIPTPKQNGRKADAIRRLMRHGKITQREIADMGDNSPGKTISRMRQDGVLCAEADNPKGFRLAPNASGFGEHKVYLWTGHVPAGFERPERRNRRRGSR